MWSVPVPVRTQRSPLGSCSCRRILRNPGSFRWLGTGVAQSPPLTSDFTLTYSVAAFAKLWVRLVALEAEFGQREFKVPCLFRKNFADSGHNQDLVQIFLWLNDLGALSLLRCPFASAGRLVSFRFRSAQMVGGGGVQVAVMESDHHGCD